MVSQLHSLGVSHHTCRWIQDFLTDRPQSVRLGSHHSSVLALSTGVPQGCVLSPLLYTHDCTPICDSNIIIKFADDTTVVGLIYPNDESAYRDEVQKLTAWCSDNNLALNSSKTKELVIDFRRKGEEPAPLYIKEDIVERVNEDLTWSVNIKALVKKAQQ
jgi:hypothetical protein